MSSKPVTLFIDDPAEDVPRLITAGGPACGGMFGLVLLPHTSEGILGWGPGRGSAERAKVWRHDGVGDCPATPVSGSSSEREIQAAIVDLRKRAPKAATENTRADFGRKNKWTGTFRCDEGAPELLLQRKLATYMDIRIEITTKGLWRWTITRKQTWFAAAFEQTGTAGKLVDAIRTAYEKADGVVASACTARDTRRKGALAPEMEVRSASQRAEASGPARGARGVGDDFTFEQAEKKGRRGKKNEEAPAAGATATQAPPTTRPKTWYLGASPGTWDGTTFTPLHDPTHLLLGVEKEVTDSPMEELEIPDPPMMWSADDQKKYFIALFAANGLTIGAPKFKRDVLVIGVPRSAKPIGGRLGWASVEADLNRLVTGQGPRVEVVGVADAAPKPPKAPGAENKPVQPLTSDTSQVDQIIATNIKSGVQQNMFALLGPPDDA